MNKNPSVLNVDWILIIYKAMRLVIYGLVNHKIQHFNLLKLCFDFSNPVFIFCILEEGSID